MAEFRVFFDLSDFEDWAKRAQSNASSLPGNLGKKLRPLAEDAIELLQYNIRKHMEEVGLVRRTGFMEENVKVSRIRERATSDGVVWSVELEGPVYAFKHEVGGVITGKPWLRIPLTNADGSPDPKLKDLQARAAELRAAKQTFVLFAGKNKQPLKRPLVVYKPASEVVSSVDKEEMREAQTGTNWLSRHDKDQKGEELIPLFFLMKEIRIPARKWLSSAIQDTQMGVSENLGELATEYGRDEGFTFTIKHVVKK